MRKICHAGGVLLLIMCIALSNTAGAQETEYVGDDPKPVPSEQADGIQLGSFLVLPEAAVTQMYDSNIFATRDNEVDDTLTILYPNLSAKSTWDKHELEFSAGEAFSQYYSNNNKDYDDY